jgi:hypothetical protein
MLNYCVQVASLSPPVIPRAATSKRSRLLLVGARTGRRHRHLTAAEGDALGHGVACVSSRVSASAYHLNFAA